MEQWATSQNLLLCLEDMEVFEKKLQEANDIGKPEEVIKKMQLDFGELKQECAENKREWDKRIAIR